MSESPPPPPLLPSRTQQKQQRCHRRITSTRVIVAFGLILIVSSTVSFQIKSLDFVAYIKLGINTNSEEKEERVAGDAVALPPPSPPTLPTNSSLASTPSTPATQAITPSTTTNNTNTNATNITNTTSESPTASPVTASPTTTEHLVRAWPQWKAALAIKRLAATTSVHPRQQHQQQQHHQKKDATAASATAAAAAATAVTVLPRRDRAMFPAPNPPRQIIRVPVPSVWEPIVVDENITLARTNYYSSDTTNNNETNDPLSQPKTTGRQKPILAIITSTFSKGKTNLPVSESLLVKHLLPSILNTIRDTERYEWRVHVYVAVDDTDTWWLTHWPSIAFDGSNQNHNPTINDSWLNLTLGVFPTQPGNIPFNEIALLAYNEGAEYLCRVNDDTEFTTPDWITTAVSTLRQMTPPNVGVVAPTCGQGNTDIMTHDFVHKTHMDIFQGHYYPPCFDNWYLDDWISSVYTTRTMGSNFSGHSHVIPSWQVKHWTFESRYSPKYLHAQWLPWEYERGQMLISSYIQNRSSNDVPSSSLISSLPRPQYMDPALVQRVLDVLPPDGNLLVWGFNGDSPFWHLATSGAVVFWAEGALIHHWFKHHPYFLFEEANFQASQRGNMEANAVTYAHNQTLTNNTWCNLVLPVPASIRSTNWDVILVEAPKVCADASRCDDREGPGVYQPLYNSQVIAALQRERNKNFVTHVLVHHYERSYEQDFSQRVFGALPHNVSFAETITTATSGDGANATTTPVTTELAHFVIDAASPIPDPACGPVMSIRDSPHLVRWSLSADAVTSSSLVQSPESWIIFMEVSDGHYEFLLNWLNHFTPLNIPIPVVIMADDDIIHAKIRKLVSKYKVTLERSEFNATSAPAALDWGTPGFNELVAIRPAHIRDKLLQGLNVIYTDVDTVWRSNPLSFLASAALGGSDFVAVVAASEKDAFSPYYGTGFFAMAFNDRTIDLATRWADQPLVDFNSLLFASQVLHQPLSWKEFPHGGLFFDQYSEFEQEKTVLVHNDFIVGFAPKKERFERFGLWNITVLP